MTKSISRFVEGLEANLRSTARNSNLGFAILGLWGPTIRRLRWRAGGGRMGMGRWWVVMGGSGGSWWIWWRLCEKVEAMELGFLGFPFLIFFFFFWTWNGKGKKKVHKGSSLDRIALIPNFIRSESNSHTEQIHKFSNNLTFIRFKSVSLTHNP